MIFSYKWINEYFEENLPKPKELARMLTLHSYEVEGSEEKAGDTLLDIDILPNRGSDSLSHDGLARELSTVLDLKLVDKEGRNYADDSVSSKDSLKLEIEDEKLVPRAMKRLVLDVEVGESPGWIKERLSVLGQKSINNIVDATNLVMLETGQPVHAFDYDKIAGGDIKEIYVRKAHSGEKIRTLDGGEYELDNSILVIADQEKPLDIAGIKGGENSGIDGRTKNVVLSVCNFNPVWIRKASRKLGLLTDASKKFEQGLTPELTTLALDRLSQVVSDIASGRVSYDILDNYPKPPAQKKVDFSLERVNNLLGVEISEEEVKDILRRLHFGYSEAGAGDYEVTVPFIRQDINVEADLIEEIGRIYGYEKIEPTLPKKKGKVKADKRFYVENKIRDILVEDGFSEVMTYVLQDGGQVELANPFASDKSHLRDSLIPGLRDSFAYNSSQLPILFGSQDLSQLKIFEIGKVFTKSGEKDYLGLACDKEKQVRGVSEKLFQTLEITSIAPENKESGGLGIWEWDLGKIIKEISDVEFYSELENLRAISVDYKKLSPYPYVLRDIAVWVPESLESSEVEKFIRESAGDLLVKAKLFDQYPKDGRVSYAFSLVFQSREKTLSDKEVGELMEKLEDKMEKEGWEVR